MMTKRLARLQELQSPEYERIMGAINVTAQRAGVSEYRHTCRLWEYPWVWFRLQELGSGLRILDIGSERSPFGWFLAEQGYAMTLTDREPRWYATWVKAKWRTHLSVRMAVMDATHLRFAQAAFDVCLSVSVIEHIPAKAAAVAEAARVLRPGGHLIITFDICEPDLGMDFPSWSGAALTRAGFDALVKDNPWFEPGLNVMPWNEQDIPAFLAWHRTGTPPLNYVAGAAMLKRNQTPWRAAGVDDWCRQAANLIAQPVLKLRGLGRYLGERRCPGSTTAPEGKE